MKQYELRIKALEDEQVIESQGRPSFFGGVLGNLYIIDTRTNRFLAIFINNLTHIFLKQADAPQASRGAREMK